MSVDAALAARASLASHRLIGWSFWDPVAIQRYSQLGVPEGRGYYIATRAAPLAAAGDAAVIAAFVSIHPLFVRFSLDQCRAHTTFADAYRVRNEAVGVGLREHAAEIVDDLGAMAPALWDAVDTHLVDARVLFAAHTEWPRSEDDPAVSAWLAVNCIREWRGDTHWAVVASHGLSGIEAGLLHDAYMGYPGEWLPRSRGADDHMVAGAWQSLVSKGLADDAGEGHRVNADGLILREAIEHRTDELCAQSWRLLGEARTVAFCELVERVGERLMARIDATAGPNWMPAARERRR